MKLSIIIPAYNAEPYIEKLITKLHAQVTKEVEVIVVDDGSDFPYLAAYPEIQVIRFEKNRGVSAARNAGLDRAKGEWVAFIDADDLVADDYVKRILAELAYKPDYVYLSWKTFGGGWDYEVILKSTKDKFPPFNLCCWNRVYKRSMIGAVRFNEKKKIAEDAEFIASVKEEGKKKAFIGTPIYFYRTSPRNSLTERFNRGELDMERIVYHLPHLPKDLTELLETVREETREAEVIIMTHDKSRELEEYCMVVPPQPIAGTVLRGIPTTLFRQIERPIHAQVVIYQGRIHEIGGVETWIYNFCKMFRDSYDIMVIYCQDSSEKMIQRLSELVPVISIPSAPVVCNVLLNMRITDGIPSIFRAKKVVQVCHLCQMKEGYHIQPKHDLVVFPSEAARKSFADQVEGQVIQNMTATQKKGKTLILVTASRFTYEKGEKRMRELAAKLTERGIPFVWWLFSDKTIKPFPGLVQMGSRYDVSSYVEAADYLVQLSDRESFCYSIVEALELGTAVLTTDIEVLDEIGFEDGKHGYKIPWDGKISDELTERIWKKIPGFKYSRREDNKRIREQWKEILGDTTKEWKPVKKGTAIEIIREYFDVELNRKVEPGEILKPSPERAEKIIFAGYAKIANNAKIAVV